MAEGILGKIAAAKREELARRFDDVSLDSLRSQAMPTQRSLAAVMASDGARFILEIKKASPRLCRRRRCSERSVRRRILRRVAR